MKNCPNCGSPIDPYRVKCEYCGTMYFDWATWLKDGEQCWINYEYDGYRKGTITALAIPRLESVNIESEPIYATNGNGVTLCRIMARKNCELHVNFQCIQDNKGRMFTVTER